MNETIEKVVVQVGERKWEGRLGRHDDLDARCWVRFSQDPPTGILAPMTPVEPEPAAFAPPWDDAPDWAEWAARDKDGTGQWFEMRPKSAGNPWWMAVGQRQAFGDWRKATRDPNWRETLTKRPEPPEPEPFPCPRCGKKMRVMPSASGGNYTWCEACNTRGPYRDTRAEAIEAHNARKSPELDPCPHCGGEWQDWLRPVSEVYFAQCDGCNFETPEYPTQWALAAAVNRRAP